MLAQLACITTIQAQPDRLDQIASPEIAQAVEWLPANSEVVAVAAEAGKTKGFDVRTNLGEDIPFLAQIGLPMDPKTGQIWPMSFDFIVQGLRNVRTPSTAGGMNPPYDGCDIVGLKIDEAARLKALAIKQMRHATIANIDAYIWELKDGGETMKLFLHFEDRLLFCATDKTYLTETLARKARPQTDRAMPESMAQWKYIEDSAPFWAIRKMDPVGSTMNTGAKVTADFPAGFCLWTSKDHAKVNVVEMDNQDQFARVKAMFGNSLQEAAASAADYKALDSTTTLVSIDAKVDAEQPMILLMGLFGHPMFM